MELMPNPHCGATLKSGAGTCGHKAGWGTDHPGYGNCKLHGGATPTGKKHAKTLRQEAWQRIMEQAEPRLTRMIWLADNAESETVQFQANRDLLDRAGLGAKHVHEHTGPDGGPIPVEVRAAELLGRARQLRPPAKARTKSRKVPTPAKVMGKGRRRSKPAGDATPGDTSA